MVVLGGLHVLSCPDEAAAARRRHRRSATACSSGRRSCATSRRARSSRATTASYRAALPRRPAAAPRPPAARGRSSPRTSLIATRGCHNRCGFCYLATDGAAHALPDVPDAEQVVARVRARPASPTASSSTTTSARDRDYLRALCRALAPAREIWSAAVTIDVTDDPALVREMALAGCTGVFVGFEIAAPTRTSPTRGKQRRRRRTTPGGSRSSTTTASRSTAASSSASTTTAPDVFERTVEWIEETRLECATFHILTPYPGTPLFRQMEAEGRLLHRDWSLYDTAHVVFRPAAHDAARSWRRATPGATGGSSRTRSIWRRRPGDCRGRAAVPGDVATSTSAATGSGRS